MLRWAETPVCPPQKEQKFFSLDFGLGFWQPSETPPNKLPPIGNMWSQLFEQVR
jgi:hypothetical protein